MQLNFLRIKGQEKQHIFVSTNCVQTCTRLSCAVIAKERVRFFKTREKKGQMSPALAPAIQASQLKWLCQDMVSEFHSDDFCCFITMMKGAFWSHSHHKKKTKPENADTVLGIKLFSLFWHMCQKAGSLFKLQQLARITDITSSPYSYLSYSPRGDRNGYKNIAAVKLVGSVFLIFRMFGCFPQCWVGQLNC